MKVEKINKLKNGKYKITLDNDNKIITYDDVILKNNLLFGKEIDLEKLDSISKDTEYYFVYNKLIKYIYTKMRSEFEIINYISKYDLEEKLENEIINKLKEIGLINDNRFMKAFISDKINLSSMGPYKIKSLLKEHKIDEDLINEEISLIDSELINEKVKKIVIKKISFNKKHSNYNLKQKLISDLINLGYSKEMIIDIIDQNLIQNNDVLEKNYNLLYKKLSSKYSDAELLKKVKSKLYEKGFNLNEINDLINKKNNA